MIGLLASGPIPPFMEIVHPTYAEQYAPTTSADLGCAMEQSATTAAQKAAHQSPLIVVDISYSASLSTMNDSQIDTYTKQILTQSDRTNAPPPLRVIIILNGVVKADRSQPGPVFGPAQALPPGVD